MFVSNFSSSSAPIQIELVAQSGGLLTPEISPQDLHLAIESGTRLQIFDLRHAADHERAHVPGSQSVPALKGEAPRLADLCQPTVPVVLYSYAGAGPSTRSIAGALAKRGLAVQVLSGGWEGWHLSGHATRKSQNMTPFLNGLTELINERTGRL